MPNIKSELLIVQHLRQRLKCVRVLNINYPSLTIAKMNTFTKILIDRQCLSIDQNCSDTLVEPIVTLQFVIIAQFVIHYKLRCIATQFVIQRISNCAVRATRFVMYYKLRHNFIV